MELSPFTFSNIFTIPVRFSKVLTRERGLCYPLYNSLQNLKSSFILKSTHLNLNSSTIAISRLKLNHCYSPPKSLKAGSAKS